MRSILIAILVLLWLILGWQSCQDYERCCNKADSALVTAPDVVSTKVTDGPIMFNMNNDVPILGEGWTTLRDSLLGLVAENNILEITGWYCTNLDNPESESIGRRRAEEIRKLFPEVKDEMVVLEVKASECTEEDKNRKFLSSGFALRKMTESIKETATSTLIYFPFNSTQKLNNKEVEAYLNDVADRVKKSGEKVELTGHTDNIGSDESNMALGKRRADIVMNYLISQGVSSSQIISSSRGESSPIADNNTEEGRGKNRRTELKIIQ